MKTFTNVASCLSLFMFLGCGSQNKPVHAVPVEDPEDAPPQRASDTAQPATPVNETVTSATHAEQGEALPRGPSKSIQVTINAKSGSKLKGSASLTEKAEGVQIVIDLEGVRPGEHATHIHEKADCSAADGSSAGEHFNPHGHQHGLPNQEQRHLGDLGNITIGKEGKGTLEIVVPGANLRDVDQHSFVGRSLIIHDKKDDGGQPSGNSGGRIGCAEIK